jgi:hypothetical protein
LREEGLLRNEVRFAGRFDDEDAIKLRPDYLPETFNKEIHAIKGTDTH